jgi:release factor glutamine methyltransferase
MITYTYHNKKIRLTPHVYEPAEDSYLVVDALVDHIRCGDRVLEIGCGCGIVSIFAGDFASLVVATDINPHAVRCAKLNGITTVRTDMFAGIKSTFNIIVFNPPYLPVLEEEHSKKWVDLMIDGGRDGRRTIKRFIEQVGDYLAPGGCVLLVISSLTGIREVCDLMLDAGLHVEPVARSKHFFEQLVVLKGWV